MKKQINADADFTHDWRDLAVLSLVISLAAVVLVGFALKIPFADVSREVAFNKAMTLAGLIIGTLGVAATVYFVIMGINIYRHAEKLEAVEKKYRMMMGEMDKSNENQYNERLDTMSSIESISDDSQHISTIRLAMGRIICKSIIHTEEYSLEMGIRYLGENSRSQEDIDLLEKIKDNTDDEKIKEQAEGAIDNIIRNKKHSKAEAELSQSKLRWWRSTLGFIKM